MILKKVLIRGLYLYHLEKSFSISDSFFLYFYSLFSLASQTVLNLNKLFKYIIISLLLVFTSFSGQLSAQTKQKPFIDTLDNAFDLSYYLYNLHGLLPIISPITEPAVGYGAVGAGLFFIPKKDTLRKGFKMPDIVGVAGGYTENGTWFTGAGYIGFWKQDRVRYRGVFGYGDIKLKYYGKGDDYLSSRPIQFSIKSYFFLQQAIFRIGDSKFLLGGRYLLGKSTVTFFEHSIIPGIDPRDKVLTNSGVGIIAEYENFDNIFSPTKGLRANITYNQFLEALGGDRDFGRISFFALQYFNVVKERWNSGFRLETQLSLGKAPFYMQPFVYLRGVPAMRYQGEFTALVETEQELILTQRWSIVGFGGYGHAFKSLDEMNMGSNVWNAGTGFRYKIARVFGLKMGLDVAKGPEQWAVYVVFGNSWMK